MALRNGCAGQELIAEINGMQMSEAEYQEQTDVRLKELETDGFHVGDIRYCSIYPGENYLLCNGDIIYSTDYAELVLVITGEENIESTTLPILSSGCGYVYIKAKEGDLIA